MKICGNGSLGGSLFPLLLGSFPSWPHKLAFQLLPTLDLEHIWLHDPCHIGAYISRRCVYFPSFGSVDCLYLSYEYRKSISHYSNEICLNGSCRSGHPLSRSDKASLQSIRSRARLS